MNSLFLLPQYFIITYLFRLFFHLSSLFFVLILQILHFPLLFPLFSLLVSADYAAALAFLAGSLEFSLCIIHLFFICIL